MPPALVERVQRLGTAVDSWVNARSLPAATAAAEEAANLVTGPDEPGYGDRDSDGQLQGESDIGLLPGTGGQPGLASDVGSTCLDADVLGGAWTNPEARWEELQAAITGWSEDNNTFPTLASHPQRIIGWATLALNSDDLAQVKEFGGHARLHATVVESALKQC